MFTIKTLNAISPVGLTKLNKNLFDVSVDADAPDGILVRSADLLNTTFNDGLLAIARAGAGVNNIPLDRCSEQGIVVFNTPGANANAVAELVIGMLIAGSRNVPAAAQWTQGLAGDPAMAKSVEKGKKQFVGNEIKGKTLGVIGLGAIGSRVANCAIELGMEVYGYADVIRINSQSGKGGIGFLLQQNYGYNPPPKMREDLGYRVKDVSDHEHRELSVKEVLGVFENSYLNHTQPLNVPDAHFIQNSDGSITANVVVTSGGSTVKCTATGNGRLDAVATAIEQQTGMHFTLVHYSEHALDSDTNSRACSYVGLKWASGEETWGCGTHTDIIVAGIKALVSAINNK